MAGDAAIAVVVVVVVVDAVWLVVRAVASPVVDGAAIVSYFLSCLSSRHFLGPPPSQDGTESRDVL